MNPDALQGRRYRDSLRLDPSLVAAFVVATGDDAERWVDHAPPSFAAAALFAVAPAFLGDPDVGKHGEVLIHAEQAFEWHRPWVVGESIAVTGEVARIRMRGETAWTTFEAAASSAAGKVMTSRSMFLMSAEAPATSVEERAEPPPDFKAEETGSTFVPGSITRRSASRADLIRYAAASGDFNPLHWDHATARNAGLPGVVVHGLLMVSWLIQAAVSMTPPIARPLTTGRFRFKQPLAVGAPADIEGTADEDTIELILSCRSEPLTTARMQR
jgi:acyl dehydratase